MQRPPARPRSTPPQAESYSSLSGPWREWHEKRDAARAERDVAEDETMLSSPLDRGWEPRPEEMTQLMPNAPRRPSAAPLGHDGFPFSGAPSPPPLSPPVPYVAAPTQGWPGSAVQPLPMPPPYFGSAFGPAPEAGPGSVPSVQAHPSPGYSMQPMQPMQPMPTMPPPAYSSAPPPPQAFGMPGLPHGMPGAKGSLPQPSGLPSAIAFALALVAVLVALLFDVIFLRVHIPGLGGYAWYLTTALSFAGAGFGGAKWTRASQTTAYTAVALSGVLYGVAGVGLGLVLEDLAMGSALFLGIQGLAIAIVSGGAGVRKGMAAKGD